VQKEKEEKLRIEHGVLFLFEMRKGAGPFGTGYLGLTVFLGEEEKEKVFVQELWRMRERGRGRERGW
jgi:hypothetical protein